MTDSHNESKKNAFILGAGVSGLVAGWMLSKNGWKVTIIEKEDIWGGLAATRKWNGFYLDFGPHIYHTVSPRLEALWEKEFGDLFVKGEFWCKNVKGSDYKEFYDYPLSYEAIQNYPPSIKGKILDELRLVSEAKKASAVNYRDYVTALVGPTLQNLFFENYPAKLWGMSTEEMTANWAPKRIELRQKRTPFYTGRWNAVGKFGTGCVMDRIAENIKKLGGKIELGQAVTHITRSETAIQELVTSSGRTIKISNEDVVISTLPLNVLAKLFGINCALKFRGVICASLAFNKPFVLPEGIHFLYYDSSKIIFHRVSEQKKFSSAGFPSDKTFVTAEIAYCAGDELDQTPDSKIISRVLDDLCLAGLVRADEFQEGIVQKRACVYPFLTRDYEHQVREVQSQLAKNKSLYIVGGPAEYNYADIHINFLKAMDLADILIDRHSDFYHVKKDNIMIKPNRVVELGGRKVGGDNRPFVIAEAGLNHNGDIQLALRLIEEARKAGCDAIKFQTYKTSNRVSSRVKKAQYAEQITGLEENVFEMLSRFELSGDDHKRLFAQAKAVGLDLFSTPFDAESIDLLEALHTPYYKVASSDLNNLSLLRKIARTGKPVILSTGMSTLGEIEESVQCILREGNPNIILLHCLSSYPANSDELNLRVIDTLKKTFRLPVGFSDHTLGLDATIAALALGADVIERHFTLDRKMEGPDHVFSSEPEEMSRLAYFVRTLPGLLGDGVKRVQPSEYETINIFKKALYAKRDIKKGDLIKESDLAVKGPAGGLQPRFLPLVVGRTARRDVAQDTPLTWDDV